MNLKEHRLYKHLSSPFRFLGLTMDEFFIGLAGFIACFVMQNKVVGILIFFVSIALMFVWRSIKKRAEGFSFVSFVNWHFGSSAAKISKAWPQSCERRWLV